MSLKEEMNALAEKFEKAFNNCDEKYSLLYEQLTACQKRNKDIIYRLHYLLTGDFSFNSSEDSIKFLIEKLKEENKTLKVENVKLKNTVDYYGTQNPSCIFIDRDAYNNEMHLLNTTCEAVEEYKSKVKQIIEKQGGKND
jgi:hypothetical protein